MTILVELFGTAVGYHDTVYFKHMKSLGIIFVSVLDAAFALRDKPPSEMRGVTLAPALWVQDENLLRYACGH